MWLSFVAGCFLLGSSTLAEAQSVAPVSADAAVGNADDRLYAEGKDPFESLNRRVFAFNLLIDDYLLTPVAKGYRTVTPAPVRDSLSSVIATLREPRTAVNALLQGDVRKTGDALTRFLVNLTFGLGGLFDVAGAYGVTVTSEDFGQTLAEWGVPAGPYLMLPLLGPSSPRDAAGTVADRMALDPVGLATQDANLEGFWYTQTAVRVVDLRSRNLENIEALRRSSVDFYARIRSLYWQRVQGSLSETSRAHQQENARLDQEFDSYFDGEEQE
jgi:phospholipid-binding lipoprotein MlaA